MKKNSQVNIWDVLRVRPFLFLWTAQILSQIAFHMLNFTLILRVYQLTKSNTAVSALIFFFVLPALLLSLFAGVLVDRFDKKIVMLFTNIIRAIAILPLVLFGSMVWMLYSCAFLISVATQFFLPAEAPMIPKIVSKKLLLPANSLFTITIYGSIIVGYVLAGPAIKFFGIKIAFLIVALLFILASIFNSLLPGGSGAFLRRQVRKLSEVTYQRLASIFFNDIGEVLYYVLRSRHIFIAIMFLAISQAVITILGALLPGYTATVLSIDVEDSSLILLAPAALGMIVGSLFIGQLGSRIGGARFIAPGVLLSGIMLFLLPIFSRVANQNVFFSVYTFLPFDLILLVVGACFLLGIFNAMVIVPSNTIIQEQSEASIRGRIYGVFNAFSALASIVPVVIAGYFSDIFGVGRVLTFIAVLIMLFGLFRFLRGGVYETNAF